MAGQDIALDGRFSQADEAKIEALKRTKFLATAALVLCVVIFLVAKMLETRWPLLGFVAAMAEAAKLVALSPNDPYFLELEGQILLESGKVADSLRRAGGGALFGGLHSRQVS